MTGTQLVKSEADSVRAALEKMKPQFAMALPKHVSVDRLLRITMTAIQNTPKLLQCDRTSLYAAVMTCAQLGLEPDGVLGQAYLLPFGNRVQLIVGYRGYITLARNSGDVVSISAHEVCEKDEFHYSFGLVETLHHVPARGARGDIIYFYAYAKFKDGGHHFDVMTREQVDMIRDNSQGYKAAKRFAKDGKIDSPWETHYEEMGKKTAIRRIAKYLPLSVQRAVALDDAIDVGRTATIDNHGDVAFPDEPAQITDERESAVSTSKLERFEKEHGGEPGDVGEQQPGPETGVKPAKAASKKANPTGQSGPQVEPDGRPEDNGVPPSQIVRWDPPNERFPSKPKEIGGDGNRVAFGPWFLEELERIPDSQVADFLSAANYGHWYDWLAANKPDDFQKAEKILEAKGK